MYTRLLQIGVGESYFRPGQVRIIIHKIRVIYNSCVSFTDKRIALFGMFFFFYNIRTEKYFIEHILLYLHSPIIASDTNRR